MAYGNCLDNLFIRSIKSVPNMVPKKLQRFTYNITDSKISLPILYSKKLYLVRQSFGAIKNSDAILKENYCTKLV